MPSERITESDMEFYLLPKGVVPGKTIYFFRKRPLSWLLPYAVQWETMAETIRALLAARPLDEYSLGDAYYSPEVKFWNL